MMYEPKSTFRDVNDGVTAQQGVQFLRSENFGRDPKWLNHFHGATLGKGRPASPAPIHQYLLSALTSGNYRASIIAAPAAAWNSA